MLGQPDARMGGCSDGLMGAWKGQCSGMDGCLDGRMDARMGGCLGGRVFGGRILGWTDAQMSDGCLD